MFGGRYGKTYRIRTHKKHFPNLFKCMMEGCNNFITTLYDQNILSCRSHMRVKSRGKERMDEYKHLKLILSYELTHIPRVVKAFAEIQQYRNRSVK